VHGERKRTKQGEAIIPVREEIAMDIPGINSKRGDIKGPKETENKIVVTTR